MEELTKLEPTLDFKVLGLQPQVDPKEGRKFDADKPRYDLEQTRALEEYVKVLTFGATKYAPDNWRHVKDLDKRYYSALRRHLSAWRQGHQYDEETKLHHLAHAMCCIAFILEIELEEADGLGLTDW